MSNSRIRLVSIGCISVLLLTLSPAHGLINPLLQPFQLAERYRAVVHARVTAVDYGAVTATVEVIGVPKGEYEQTSIILTATTPEGKEAIFSLGEGQDLVAYAGKRMRHGKNDILVYNGTKNWIEGERSEDGKTWVLSGNADKDKDEGQIMFGTFNGLVSQLAKLSKDYTLDRDYFPAKPVSEFGLQDIATLPNPVSAVAASDFNGDGRVDVAALTGEELILYSQTEAGGFAVMQTLPRGGASLCPGDVDLDGDVDLLVDNRILLNNEGQFAMGAVIGADDLAVQSSVLADISGDGRADAVFSVEEGGVDVFVQTEDGWQVLAAQEGLNNATDGQSGYVEVGDWNGDSRLDILYGTGTTLTLLTQSDGQSFDAAILLDEEIELDQGAFTGIAWGPLWDEHSVSIVLPCEFGNVLLVHDGDFWVDRTALTNEFQEPIDSQVAALCNDFNADGTVDLFSLAGTDGNLGTLNINRGYGSYMMTGKYKTGIIPSAANGRNCRVGLTCDINRDGAVDMVMGSQEGHLFILTNKVLANRPATVSQETTRYAARQIRTHHVVAEFTGRSVRGAQLRLIEPRKDKDAVMMVRLLGGTTGLGNGGPESCTFSVRTPGSYTLELRAPGIDPIHQPLIVPEEASKDVIQITFDLSKK